MARDQITEAQALTERPHSLEIEQALLGAVIMADLHRPADVESPGLEACLREGLTAEDFVVPAHGALFGIMGQLGQKRLPITIAALLPFLPDEPVAPDWPWSKYLARLAREAIPLNTLPDYARLLRDLATRRAIVRATRKAADDAATAPPDRGADVLLADTVAALQKVADKGLAQSTRSPIGEAVARMLDHARAIKDGVKQADGVPTGLVDLDRQTGGMQGGMFWVVGARPGMGKTALMVTIANNVGRASVKRERADLPGWGVLEYSLEVPEEQLVARHVAEISFLPRSPIQFGRIMAGDIDDEEIWRLQDAQKRLDEMPIILETASRTSVAEIRLRVRAEKARFARQGVELRVVLIDYLKFIKAGDRYQGNRVYEIGEITAGLKQIAKDEGVCIVLFAQLNRALESRDDKRPTLSDLRESGDLEADADVVLFLHRESYFLAQTPQYRNGAEDAIAAFEDARLRGELIVGKNRHGATRLVALFCDIAASTFSNAGGDR